MSESVTDWSPQEAYEHCLETWRQNFRRFPDLLEPYVPALDNADTDADRLSIMRQSLAETFKRRYPAP